MSRRSRRETQRRIEEHARRQAEDARLADLPRTDPEYRRITAELLRRRRGYVPIRDDSPHCCCDLGLHDRLPSPPHEQPPTPLPPVIRRQERPRR